MVEEPEKTVEEEVLLAVVGKLVREAEIVPDIFFLFFWDDRDLGRRKETKKRYL